VIVGFPGETEADFEETLQVIEQVKFAKVHMFPYSPRKRTRAALYPNQIPADVVRSRKQRLLRLAEKTGFELRQKFVGRTMQVLLENETKPGFIAGHTANFLRVWVPVGHHKPNELVQVKLVGNEPDGLIGL
jgi:threonylcarbamoyladenosine tRNA methylthiotransferase MtaB